MLNLQLAYLNGSRLDALGEEELYLRLEPFSLKRKRLAQMRPGNWVDLGSEPPAFELARGGRRVAGVVPSEAGVVIRSLAAENEEGPEYKRVLLEGRLAVLPDEVLRTDGELTLPWNVVERIYLYAEGARRAVAVLVRYDEGYALEILEVENV